ncbi:MAG: anti-sigma factor [Flavobacteriaceae bacterium]|nr:anti-sigma factor [Flavobacteriaceae bacterium]
MIKKIYLLAFIALGVITVSCDSDDDAPTTGELTLDLSGLEPLGSDFVYEGWLIVDGSPVSTGVFTSVTFPQSFTVGLNDLTTATTFVLSIEPLVDTDPAPAATKILAGDFSGNSASVTTNGVVGDYTNAFGKYILATPSDGTMTNENSGVWFLGSLPPTAGLSLPTLPSGWIYEGWAVIDGMAVTTGTFSAVDMPDSFNDFSGMGGVPPFPGEDFLMNAPSGLTFPVDLSGMLTVISIEPVPDDSPTPFSLKPLIGHIPNPAMDHVVLDMTLHLENLATGTVTR